MMHRKVYGSIGLAVAIFLLSASIVFAQGDNTPDPLVNLGCIDGAVLSGSVPEGEGRGIPSDILWDPATGDYKTPSDWHEYGLSYNATVGGITKENPMWWQVEWPTAKNINYITCTGPYGNQPQPHTGWAVQIWDETTGSFIDLPKADHGWDADFLTGVGGWVSDGLLEWRGMVPVVTTKLRLIAYANPDSLADGADTFADSLWSMVFVGRQMSAQSPKSVLIQYLDYAGEAADNAMDEMVNLGLIHEAVVSGSYIRDEIQNLRGQPADMLFDPVKGDFNNTNTPWGEFGMPYQYDAGFVEEDAPFYWMVEWPVPKNVNYFSWGGVYGNQPQPTTPWAVQYWNGDSWEVLMDGVGGSLEEGLMGVDVDAESVWQSETAIQTTRFRFAVWSDGVDPLFSYHIRGRGGSTQNWDERGDTTFKAILLQFKELATGVAADGKTLPSEFSLHPNYPNPFNPQTNIVYTLQQGGQVRLSLYNVQGQEVAVLVDGMKSSGRHQVTFDAKSLNSGVYFYRIETDQGILTRKMMLMK